MALIDKLLSKSTIKDTSPLLESTVFGIKDQASTDIPMVNVALSGDLEGGLGAGLLMLAGPSKHFKSAFGLVLAAAWQKRHPDGVILFYDSEFGSPPSYFRSFGVDMNRVIHTPITNVEEFRHDLANQLENISRGDKVMIVTDSIGNLASKKEVKDAISGNEAADMTRAKQLKSTFRIATPHLTLKNIPMIAINHTYKEIGMFPKDIVSGGTGGYYSADAIWIIGRQQDKGTEGIKGYHFIINIEKSRHVREKTKIPVTVRFDGGIEKWSGMLDISMKGGFVRKPKVGWYEAVNPDTGEVISDKMWRQDELLNSDADVFWNKLIAETKLASYIKSSYTIVSNESTEKEIVEDA